MKRLLIIAFLIGAAWVSWWLAPRTHFTDFPVFYSAGKTIISGGSVYDFSALASHAIPENHNLGAFIYSLPIAYLFSLLSLLPYYAAKSVMTFILLLSYFSAIYSTLKMSEVKDRWFGYPLISSFVFLPFLMDLLHAQTNSIILLLVVLSVWFANKDKPYLCGFCLAFAAMFKIFPVGIALILGLKNWRVIAGFAIVFASSFLLPGSWEWFSSIRDIFPSGYHPLFAACGPIWFAVYGSIVAGASAIIVWRSEETNPETLVAFAIPAVFLSMPLVEYYHLVVLAAVYVFMLPRINHLTAFALAGSFILISYPALYRFGAPVLLDFKTSITIGLLFLWAPMAFITSQKILVTSTSPINIRLIGVSPI